MYKITNHLYFDEPRKLFKFVMQNELTLEKAMCLMYSYKDVIGEYEVYIDNVNMTSLFRKMRSETEMWVAESKIVWVYPIGKDKYLVLHCYYISQADIYQYNYADEIMTKDELKELGYEKCQK